ncbi:helix-turn-helix domain-containing protein [Luteipulveratus mongoliensis]|uniref:HTH cro/C1-type domain-containing protein n=1 Tax=Luteipulveratus mongoliensis TaxID=571913 RepID=A0A0K1JEN9_9MICO|nr:helix-turn-helix domain-containing protein [Luteipulveratus mongoliensis]AKU15060.1 hypothetical protein VV02_02960 [Luteipulveratus mongoliensis]
MAAPERSPGADLRRARVGAGLSQRTLAGRSGVAQPHIARIEAGHTQPTPSTIERLMRALQPRPSESLHSHVDEVRDLVRRHRGTGQVKVFGSIARGEDRPDSDVDLLVEFESGADLFDVMALEVDLTELLGCPVDVVPASATGRVAAHAARDAVAL